MLELKRHHSKAFTLAEVLVGTFVLSIVFALFAAFFMRTNPLLTRSKGNLQGQRNVHQASILLVNFLSNIYPVQNPGGLLPQVNAFFDEDGNFAGEDLGDGILFPEKNPVTNFDPVDTLVFITSKNLIASEITESPFDVDRFIYQLSLTDEGQLLLQELLWDPATGFAPVPGDESSRVLGHGLVQVVFQRVDNGFGGGNEIVYFLRGEVERGDNNTEEEPLLGDRVQPEIATVTGSIVLEGDD